MNGTGGGGAGEGAGQRARPPRPRPTAREWGRRFVSGIGRTCVGVGTLLLLFVAYQLWGTGLATARDQRQLEAAFDARLADLGITLGDPETGTADPVPADPVPADPITLPTPSPASTAPTPTAPPAPTSTAPTSTGVTAAAPTTRPATGETGSRDRRTRRLEARPGDLVARIRIPAIGVDDIVVAGVKKDDLKRGPGHYPGTPLPGSPGNAAIAGHRTTYGAPFFRLNDLRPGDPIFVATVSTGRWFRYEVTGLRVVSPHDNSVLRPRAGRNTLTLTTCNPRYSAAQRLIVTADLVGGTVDQEFVYLDDGRPDATDPESTVTPTAAPTDTPTAPTDTTAAPTDTASPAGTAAGPELRLDARATQGRTYSLWWLRGTGAQWRDLGGWAAVFSAACIGVWVVARGRRARLARWGIYAGGALLVALPLLYVVFENLTRLLPENV